MKNNTNCGVLSNMWNMSGCQELHVLSNQIGNVIKDENGGSFLFGVMNAKRNARKLG